MNRDFKFNCLLQSNALFKSYYNYTPSLSPNSNVTISVIFPDLSSTLYKALSYLKCSTYPYHVPGFPDGRIASYMRAEAIAPKCMVPGKQ